MGLSENIRREFLGGFSRPVGTPDVNLAGTIWRNQDIPNGQWLGLGRGPENWVLCPLLGNSILYSPDAINWSVANIASATVNYQDCAYGAGLYIMAASNDNLGLTNGLRSVDGITWVTQNIRQNNIRISTIEFLNGKFIALSMAASATFSFMVSNDGLNWNNYGTGVALIWNAVSYLESAGLWVAVRNSGAANQQVATSPDGITWTLRTSAANNWWVGLAASPTRLVAVASGGGEPRRAMYSDNGINWTMCNSIPACQWSKIRYENNRFVAIAQTKVGVSQVAISDDGIDFVAVETPAPTRAFVGLRYGDDTFLAVPNTLNPDLLISP